ncbi:hypothetical protein [Mesorhizobium silamurunense]|uniref:hypothetical protein n=1 Tax=Mesorhizobium silamurunense TaxID=499528 RepID=UPI001786FB5E|nr:hypothetical protein [Mesorhizobium silamurunense]
MSIEGAATVNSSMLGNLSLWNGIYPDDPTFIFENANSPDFRAVELEANADTATVLRNENCPALSSAVRSLSQMSPSGSVIRRSNSSMTNASTPELLASFSRVHSTNARAARHWAPVIIIQSPVPTLSGAISPSTECQHAPARWLDPSKMDIESGKGKGRCRSPVSKLRCKKVMLKRQ